MDIKYDELRNMFNQHFTLKYMGNDITNKLALISLVCYLTFKLKQKNPDVTPWSILYKLNLKANSPVPEDCLKSLAVMCEDFGYGASEFPTFGLQDKDMPAKIIEILSEWLPF